MKSKSTLVNVTRQEDALTDNGALTNSTSLDSVLDLFFIAGACRQVSEKKIIVQLEKSWAEDANATLRLIFWAGDIRKGAGERRFFRVALHWLEDRFRSTLLKNSKFVPEFNRWDSLFTLKSEEILYLVFDALNQKDGLCAKWMPRKKQYDNFAKKFRAKFNMTERKYRKLIVGLSQTVEQHMCSKKWSDINYEHVPSMAMNKYRDAFSKNDQARFAEFNTDVEKGDKEIKAGAIFPYDIYRSSIRSGDKASIINQWNALPNYLEDSTERILPVCDVSYSMECMEGLPMAISVSLGVYLSERNTGLFKDAFITFSASPTMQYLKGDVIARFKSLNTSDWGMNTNLNKVFDLVLTKAIKNSIPESQMPTTLLIISDMEFDSCGRLTNYQSIVEKYKTAGYKIPKIVFWNVNGRPGNVPVEGDHRNVALVSGASPSIMTAILNGKDFSPLGIMKETLNNPRYDCLKV